MQPKFKKGDRVIIISNQINAKHLWGQTGTIKSHKSLPNHLANNATYGNFYYEIEWDDGSGTVTPAEKQIEHEFLVNSPLINALKEDEKNEKR